jgi:hypothetical protein
VANAAHAGAVPPVVAAVVGTVVAGLAPVAVLLATHTLARLIVAPPEVEPTTDDADAALARWQDDPRLFRVADLSRLQRPAPTPAVEPRVRARELSAQGLTVREVAAALGRPSSTVHSWLKAAS